MGTISNELSSKEEQKLSMILSYIRKHIPNRPLRESIQLLETMAIQRSQLAAQTVLTECLEIILDSAMLPEVAKISHLSRGYRAFVLEYLRRRVDGLLRTWFTDPACFRDILKTTSSMVSGSTALAFALGVDWGVQDLDIYVGRDISGWRNPTCRRGQLLKHLVEVEGYRPQAAFGDAPDPTFSGISSTSIPGASHPGDYGTEIDTIEAIYKLTKPRTITGQKEPITTHIDVIECEHTNPIKIIPGFHSTQVMNWISADNITITFPVLTFAMRGVVNQNRPTIDWPKDGLWEEKYVARGFEIFDTHNSLDIPCGTSCVAISRSSYDIGCMRMPYGQGSVVDQFGAINWNVVEPSEARHWSSNPRKNPCFEASKLPLSRPLGRVLLGRVLGTGQPESRAEDSWGWTNQPQNSGERGSGGSQPGTIRGGRGQPNHQLQTRGGARGEGRGQLETRGRGGRAQPSDQLQNRGGTGRGGGGQLATRGRGGRVQPGDQSQNIGGASRGGAAQHQTRGAEGRGGRARSRRRGGQRGQPS